MNLQQSFTEKRTNAFRKILLATRNFSALAAYHLSTLSALALIITNTDPNKLHPAIATIAGGVGVNLLSDLIKRIAIEEDTTDDQIINELQNLLIESGVSQALSTEEFRNELEKLSGGLDLPDILRAVEEGKDELTSQLISQTELLNKLLSIHGDQTEHTDLITQNPSIALVVQQYLAKIKFTLSENTVRTYHNAMVAFCATLADHGLPTNTTKITELKEDAVAWFAADMKAYAPATERLYLTAVTGFFKYLVAERLIDLNLQWVHLLIRQRARRLSLRLPQFPKEDIEKVISYATNLAQSTTDSDNERLRNLRDRAFVITLADTGLRVHEACGLH